MLDALERNDIAAWNQLQSAERRGAPDTMLRMQLDGWRTDVLPLAPNLRRVRLAISRISPQWFVTYRVDGAEPDALAHVVDEHGVLRLDET
jgi:hypothetical protein